jgi:hypothetical protein
MGGIQPIGPGDNFAGTERQTHFFCDLSVIPEHRGEGAGQAITKRRVDHLMATPTKDRELLFADLTQANAVITNKFLN